MTPYRLVTLLAVPSKGRAAILGASHGPCMCRQATRQAMPCGLSSFIGSVQRWCKGVVQHLLTHVLRVGFMPWQQKALARLGGVLASQPWAYCCQAGSPQPPKGAMGGHVNITCGYTQCPRGPKAKHRPAPRIHCALRRITSAMLNGRVAALQKVWLRHLSGHGFRR